ncbi:PLP-dependent aminotransferase family protein [Bordetella sp. FB-8]|uniref:MocR-like pyridoxine biosynthesis transcription factor PdxR n=1 Tax=Bordetella sp. FB-8 TaxID=1159870 RepID=UPI00036D69CD|nr:PLP-dependent aminotransferase family protein [Bordetella sp. FB-8]
MDSGSFTLADWLQQWLDVGADEPAYRQLYRLIRDAILDNRLTAGARLASSRVLARDLSIARNTVLQVYEQLEIEGYVTAATGRGTFVVDISQDMPDQAEARASAPSSRSPAQGLSPRGSKLIEGAGFSNRQWGAFMPGIPDVAEFPYKAWNRIQGRHWRRAPTELLIYAPAGGYEPLRHEVANYLNSARSVNGTAEQVVMTTGIHQAVDVATRLLCQPGDLVWIEEPSYWGVRNLLLSSGLRVVSVPVDDEGMCLASADLSRPPRLIVVSPSHQYPLGMVMSLARRRMLLEYARQHGCWILEDDYDSEFRYGSRPLPSLQGLDESGLVLYAGSFSKTLFPGLRVGYLVVPEHLSSAFAVAVAELYREGQLITQSILAEFIREGHLSSHIRRVRNLYAERRVAMIAAIERHFGDSLEIHGGQAGLHLVLGLPPHVDDCLVTKEAFVRGVIVRSLSRYYMRRACVRQGLLLGYASVPLDRIDAAFDVLATVICRHVRGEII